MNEDGTIDHASGSPISGGAFTITSLPSLVLLANGNGVFSGPLAFTFAGGSAPGLTGVSGGGSIPPTALKVTTGGLAVIRAGDTGTLTALGIPPSGPPVPISGPVEVTDAGQNVVEAT